MARAADLDALAERVEHCRRLNAECEPSAAMIEIGELLALPALKKAPGLFAAVNLETAIAKKLLGVSDEALEMLHIAIRIWSELGDDYHLARAKCIYCEILLELGLTDEADAQAIESIALAKASKNRDALVRALDFRAIILAIGESFDMADKFLMEATAELGDDNGPLRGHLLSDRGFSIGRRADCIREAENGKIDKEKYWQAIKLTEQAWAVNVECRDRNGQRLVLCNLAEYYAIIGEIELAAQRLDTWESVPGEKLNLQLLHYKFTKSEFHSRIGQSERAIEVVNEALLIAEKTTGIDMLTSLTRRAAEAHEEMGDYKSALANHKRLHTLFKQTVGEKAHLRAQITEIEQETQKVRRLLDMANRRASHLTEEAHQDPLTGLANRRTLDRELTRLEYEKTNAYALAILDLDHFKQINDTFSHLVGDDVLRMVADVMRKNCRNEDLAIRMGGEEFVILMPDLAQDVAIKVCERVRKAIYAAGWVAIAENLKVTVSIGLAFSDEGSNPLNVFALADARLYSAKAGGRDRVEWQATGGAIESILN